MRLLAPLLIALALALGATACGGSETAVTRTSTAAIETTSPGVDVGPWTAIGFRDERHLHEHFLKHGREFGRITQAEYLLRAQQLRVAPVGGDILEIRRGDGVISRFDRRTGAFIAFEEDGTIRTFFRPRDGERYFRRQAGRSH